MHFLDSAFVQMNDCGFSENISKAHICSFTARCLENRPIICRDGGKRSAAQWSCMACHDALQLFCSRVRRTSEPLYYQTCKKNKSTTSKKKQLFFLTVPCASTLVRCSAGVSAESSLPPLVLGLKPTDTLPFSISVGCVIFDSLLFAAGVVFLHAAWSLHNFLSWPASNWAWPKQPSSNQRCAKSNQIMAATFLWCLQCHCSSFPSKLWLCLSRFFQQCQDLYENKCLRILLRLARSSTWRTSLTKARGKYKKDL